jgi:AcrR family transcriptional regulator
MGCAGAAKGSPCFVLPDLDPPSGGVAFVVGHPVSFRSHSRSHGLVVAMPSPRPSTSPRKRPVQERATVTVDAILRASAHILSTEGYDALSTNAVARRAGVSIGSLYQYFPNKEALVAALADRHRTEVLASLAVRFEEASSLPLEAAVRHLVAGVVAAHATDVALHRALSEQTPRVGRLKELIEAIEVHGAGMLRMLLEARRAELRVRDPALAAYLVAHTVEAITHHAVLGETRPASIAAIEDEVVDLILRYLGRDPATAPPLRGRGIATSPAKRRGPARG